MKDLTINYEKHIQVNDSKLENIIETLIRFSTDEKQNSFKRILSGELKGSYAHYNHYRKKLTQLEDLVELSNKLKQEMAEEIKEVKVAEPKQKISVDLEVDTSIKI